MQFTITNNAANYDFMKFRIYMDARRIILFRRLNATDKILEQYLIDNYKLDLRTICLQLIQRCKIYKDLSHTIVVLFPNKKDDELASLITYGNGEIKGSNILKDAFCRD